ncbi:MAG: hypothetical protein ACI4SU_06335 [Anaerovoracaceae bacterium]
MRNFIHSLLADMELERLQLAKCKKELRNLPEGRLRTGNHGRNLYYRPPEGAEKYIRFQDRLAEKLALRRFLEKKVQTIEKNLQCQNYILQRYLPYTDEKIVSTLPKVYRNQMVKMLERKYSNRLSDDGIIGYGGKIRHKTPEGEGRDSKGEVILSMSLDGYGIPYRYGEPLSWKHGMSEEADQAKKLFGIPDMVIADFIFDMPDGRKKYWEHLGKLDDIKYVNKWMKKMMFYFWMGITPVVNLIITADDCNGTIDMEAISEIIESQLQTLIRYPKQRKTVR